MNKKNDVLKNYLKKSELPNQMKSNAHTNSSTTIYYK